MSAIKEWMVANVIHFWQKQKNKNNIIDTKKKGVLVRAGTPGCR